jgi:hypothetical protein
MRAMSADSIYKLLIRVEFAPKPPNDPIDPLQVELSFNGQPVPQEALVNIDKLDKVAADLDMQNAPAAVVGILRVASEAATGKSRPIAPTPFKP